MKLFLLPLVLILLSVCVAAEAPPATSPAQTQAARERAMGALIGQREFIAKELKKKQQECADIEAYLAKIKANGGAEPDHHSVHYTPETLKKALEEAKKTIIPPLEAELKRLDKQIAAATAATGPAPTPRP